MKDFISGAFVPSSRRARLAILRGAAVTIAALLLSGSAGAQPDAIAGCPPLPDSIHIAFVAFHGEDEGGRKDGLFASAERYLEQLSHDSFTDRSELRCPIEIQVSIGNYYQVQNWLKSGQIDGAVVSAFFSWILEQQNVATTVGELTESDRPEQEYTSYRPVIASTFVPGEAYEPRGLYDSFLKETLDSAARPDAHSKCERAKTAQVWLVSHLSSSGFAAPVAYALDWLRANHREDLATPFWDYYFSRVRFQLSHAPEADQVGTSADGPPRIYFSYDRSSGLTSTQSANNLGEWLPLASDSLTIPPDRLVLTSTAIKNLLRSDGKPLAPRLIPAPGNGAARGYTAFTPVHSVEYAAFAARLACTWGQVAGGPDCPGGGSALAELYRNWYEDSAYRFPLPDLMTLLRAERRSAAAGSSVALVLPGGGVKSAYQARILDQLYDPDRGYLAAPDVTHPRDRIKIGHVIGTSGGAMMGLLASQLGDKPRRITPVWSDGTNPAVSDTDIFPLIGPLRYAAIYAGLALFGLVLKYLRLATVTPAHLDGERDKNPSGSAPPLTTVFWLALLVCASSATVPLTASIGRPAAYVATIESVIFFGTIVFAHFIWTCGCGVQSIGLPGKHAAPARSSKAVVAILTGLAILLTTLSVWYAAKHPQVRMWRGVGQRVWYPSLIGMVGVVVGFLALAIHLHAGSARAGLIGVKEYGKAVSVFLCGLLVAGAVFYIGLWRGCYTRLELTLQFWIAVGISSVVAGGICTALASRQAGRHLSKVLSDGIRYLRSSQVIMKRETTPARTLLFFLGCALVAWVGAVSPALYDSSTARNFFANQVRGWAGGGPPALHANLVVTATSLSAFHSENRALPPGDVYFCFDGIEGCPTVPNFRWKRSKPAWDDLFDRVFASGSPFPVFPAFHLASTGINGNFVDGGYVHNVPIDAARLAGARAAIVVYSEPKPIDEQAPQDASQLGGLSRNAPRLIPFMFDRSQQADRDEARGLIVVGIAPRGDGQPFPLLTDFRPSQITRLIACADCDIAADAPIGFVESWGQPRTVKTIGGRKGLVLTSAGWNPSVSEPLMLQASHAPRGSAAVFDMDDTLLIHDLGDAVFRRLIIGLRYHGEREDFWKLIKEPRRERLRRFFENGDGSRRPPVTVDEVLRDKAGKYSELRRYFMLFEQEYEEHAKANAKESCGWLAQLLVGMTEDEVTDLTRDAFLEENRMPLAGQVLIEDIGPPPRVDPVHVDLGVRVRPQMRELVRQLRQMEFNVYLVSATNHYSVQFAAERLGIDPSNAVGVELQVDHVKGRFTANEPLVPYGQSKVDALPSDLRPWLVAGDSMGDLEMLKRATNVALVLDHGKIPATELKGDAQWLVQSSQALDNLTQ